MSLSFDVRDAMQDVIMRLDPDSLEAAQWQRDFDTMRQYVPLVADLLDYDAGFSLSLGMASLSQDNPRIGLLGRLEHLLVGYGLWSDLTDMGTTMVYERVTAAVVRQIDQLQALPLDALGPRASIAAACRGIGRPTDLAGNDLRWPDREATMGNLFRHRVPFEHVLPDGSTGSRHLLGIDLLMPDARQAVAIAERHGEQTFCAGGFGRIRAWAPRVDDIDKVSITYRTGHTPRIEEIVPMTEEEVARLTDDAPSSPDPLDPSFSWPMPA